ncbi:MAG: hypothetical protein RL722_242 [Pseudomonadota bacterium]|jgi:DNA-directed RNA polymerase subunit RPC12/RpoP
MTQHLPTSYLPAANERTLAAASHRCHRCGASCYRPVIARDNQGAMRASGLYRCVGCQVEFSQVAQWREGRAWLPARDPRLGAFRPLVGLAAA